MEIKLLRCQIMRPDANINRKVPTCTIFDNDKYVSIE